MGSVEAPAYPLTLRLAFVPDHVVLVVCGVVNSSTAHQLETVLAGLADREHRSVVMDLAECEYIDPAGWRVIVESAQHLTLWGRTLALRSPSMAVRRLLGPVGETSVVLLDGPDGQADATSTTQAPPGAGASLPATAPVDGEGADTSLARIVGLARALVFGADGASMSLRSDDHLATVAASDGTVLAMDAEQYATGQGPSVDASTLGVRFYTESLATEARWPAFTPRARTLGIGAIMSSPLLVRDRAVGALNIYSTTAKVFASEDLDLAGLFAAEASTILRIADAVGGPHERFGWLTEALDERYLVAVAQGVLMERSGIDQTDAYRALRQYGTRTGRPIREWAEHIVASTHPPAQVDEERPTSAENFYG